LAHLEYRRHTVSLGFVRRRFTRDVEVRCPACPRKRRTKSATGGHGVWCGGAPRDQSGQ